MNNEQVIREGVEAAFEERDGWRIKIAAAVRALATSSAPATVYDKLAGNILGAPERSGKMADERAATQPVGEVLGYLVKKPSGDHHSLHHYLHRAEDSVRAQDNSHQSYTIVPLVAAPISEATAGEVIEAHARLSHHCVALFSKGEPMSLVERIDELYSWYAEIINLADAPEADSSSAAPSEISGCTFGPMISGNRAPAPTGESLYVPNEINPKSTRYPADYIEGFNRCRTEVIAHNKGFV